MGQQEKFSGCTIKRELNKSTLNISQLHIIAKRIKDLIMTLNHLLPLTPLINHSR